MKPNVLLIGNLHVEAEDLLKSYTNMRKVSLEEFNSTELFPDVEVVVLRTFVQFGENEIIKFPKLKNVVSCSVGIDNIDLSALKSKKVELVHCLGTNANSVAEHTLYLILSLLRLNTPFYELKNKTIGIIGLGAIGKIVAEKLSGFSCKVIAFDVIEQDHETLEKLKVEMKTIDEVVSQSDILTIHVPLNKHTKGLIDSKLFAKMKDEAFFVNTSRGDIVVEKDLLEFYQREKFSGLGLDVCSDWLRSKLHVKDTVVTNHIAAQGRDSFREMCVKPIKKLLNL